MFYSFLIVVGIVLTSVYITMILYYCFGWAKKKEWKAPEENSKSIKISVIVAARNEEKNIEACINSLLNQSYPKELTEIIIVDDHSVDKTPELLVTFSRIKIITLNDNDATGEVAFKKRALTKAISSAEGELIVTTDADCVVSVDWLQTIVNYYASAKYSMIVMPVKIKTRFSFLSVFEILDFLTLQGLTGGASGPQKLSLCNGANLAYTKKIFQAVDGFSDINDIASGDDMLFMQKVRSAKGKIGYLKSRNIIAETQPAGDYRSFFMQRKRWASKFSHYKDDKIISLMLLVFLTNLSLLALAVWAVFNNKLIFFSGFTVSVFDTFCILWLFKAVVDFIYLFLIAGFFKQRILLWWFPIMQLMHLFYVVYFGLRGKVSSYEWKGRVVK